MLQFSPFFSLILKIDSVVKIRKEKIMFCYQCQETAKGQGCTIQGVCGKKESTAILQDFLIWITKGLAQVNQSRIAEGKENNLEANHKVTKNLFMTITNANFSDAKIIQAIDETIDLKEDLLKDLDHKENLAEPSLFKTKDKAIYLEKGSEVGVLSSKDQDLRSLRELMTYGLKGLSAYTKHANALLKEDPDIHNFIQEALTVTLEDHSIEDMVGWVLKTGEYGVKGMALLDEANTSSYGHPEMTEVSIEPRKNPGILVSGHDLRDLEMLLDQTKDSGVDIYTHSEMLPANYYPKFKKYDHFVGNYGNAWWRQKEEFEAFHGPILMTTNCIVPPKESYKDKLFTTGAAGYPGCQHIEGEIGEEKDFSEIIALAKTCPPPEKIEEGSIIGGFAHDQVFALADKVVDAVKSGAIKKFVVMAGCDGRNKDRDYYTDFAKALPEDTVILTAGCAKYRYNKLDLGHIQGIPRVLDAGQCNDSYSLVLIALKLAEIFKVDSVNDLPIAYNIAWYEQKAVIVLLALLSLGVENIHLGPSLPAFISPNVLKVLVEKFKLAPNTTVEADMKELIG